MSLVGSGRKDRGGLPLEEKYLRTALPRKKKRSQNTVTGRGSFLCPTGKELQRGRKEGNRGLIGGRVWEKEKRKKVEPPPETSNPVPF